MKLTKEILNLYQIGDLVRIIAGPDKGNLCYVYELYPDFDNPARVGISLLTLDGRDLGGWSDQEQTDWLEYVGKSGYHYSFDNAMQLWQDSRYGELGRRLKKIVASSKKLEK